MFLKQACGEAGPHAFLANSTKQELLYRGVTGLGGILL